MKVFIENHRSIDNMNNIVAVFNRGYSKIVVDGGAYVLYNNNIPTPYIFSEAIDILAIIPKPENIERNEDATLKYLYIIKHEDELN